MTNPDSEIIQDGDYAGRTTDDVLLEAYSYISAVLEQMNPDVANALLDMQLQVQLAVIYQLEGPEKAREVALNFIATAAPHVLGRQLEGPEQAEQLAIEAMKEIVEE